MSKYDLKDKLIIKNLQNRFPKSGRFYTLPKIHKPGSPPPGRPIVSGSGSVTEIISSFSDHFLKERVSKLPSYIQDTTHFLRVLREVGPLPPNSRIFTADVISLYTHIPHTDGLAASQSSLNDRESPDIPTQFLIELMEFVLKNNNFTFNGKNYLQLQGTAMGTKMAPSYACLFMGALEQDILAKSPDKPLLWVRFIDDIFGIWTHSLEKWNKFYEHLNSSHSSIKFVGEISDTCLPFLDVMVKLNNGRISTDLYTKPTNSHNYLPWDSCHPKSTKIGIPKSQALRIKRICSEQADFNKRLYQLGGYLRSCNYPPKYINSAFALVRSISRDSALEYNTPQPNTRVTFPITFHPNLGKLPLYDNVQLHDPDNKIIFQEPPMVAYRRPPNLRSLITRASITPSQGPNNNGFFSCSSPKCKIHEYNVTGDTFYSSMTKKSYKILPFLDCYCHDHIYLITCTKPNCGQQYVGETGRRHIDRTPEHLRDIQNSADSPIAYIFVPLVMILNIKHFSIQIIERCGKNSTPFRRIREKYWQDVLKTQINIINCTNL